MELNGTYVQSWWINRLFESKAFKKAVKARWNDRKLYLKNGKIESAGYTRDENGVTSQYWNELKENLFHQYNIPGSNNRISKTYTYPI